jgi:hypothetical protein
LRFPWPKTPVQVVLKKRDAENAFREIWSTVVDPESRAVNPPICRLRESCGPCSRTAPRLRKSICSSSARDTPPIRSDKFHRDVQRLVGRLFEYEPSRRAGRTSTCARSIFLLRSPG